MNKNVFKIIILVLSLFLIVGCELSPTTPIDDNGDVLDIKLEKPIVRIINDELTWEAVEHAEYYNVWANDELVSAGSSTSFNLEKYHNDYYVFKVQTKSHKKGVEASDFAEIKYNYFDEKIATPVLTIKGDELTWAAVEHASSYQIYVDGELKTTTDKLSYSLVRLYNALHEIKVVALTTESGYKNSDEAKIEFEEYKTHETDKYSVLMINDTHGAFADGEYPGIDRVATIAFEQEATKNLIKVANGDIFQGSYVSNVLSGRPLIEALNLIGFDAFVIGNHDFDWGLDVIHQYADGNLENGEANFPFLGANIYDKKTNKMVDWLEPYTIVDNDGLKVGIIGIIGYNLESSILAENIQDYDLVYPVQIIKTYANELRTEKGCDSVLVSIHDYDEDLNKEIAKLQGNYAIDGILCGHTHQDINQTLTRTDGKKIPVVQNRDKNRSATVVDFDLSNNSFKVTRYSPASYEEDEELLSLELSYQSYIDAGNRVLGTGPYISRQELGAYATDALCQYFKTDIGIINTGGVRAYIQAGEITVSDVFDVFPFNNEVITLKLSGSEIKALYQKNGDFLYFNTSFDTSKLQNNSYYSIAVIDYVFTGVYYDEFKGVDFVDTDIIMRDILINYIDNLY